MPMLRYIFASLLLFQTLLLSASPITLPDSIWRSCKNGEDSLHALYQFHRPYMNKDVLIKYPARKIIHLTVTDKSQTIWLPRRTDFNGCTFFVTNQSKKHFLFAISNPDATAKPVNIAKAAIDSGDFTNYNELHGKLQMLLVEDQTPWVETREGYSYGALRSDILMVRNGKALNKVTANYNTPSSNPKCRYIDTDDEERLFSNVTLIRSASSTNITNLLVVSMQNNVVIENVRVKTPAWTDGQPHEGDQCFRCHHSTNITFRDVTIEGTYSDYNKYGYGINMDNVWNATFLRLKAESQWGIFGNNNIHTATLQECDINRFDIHCYGSDITFRQCTFRNELNAYNRYNQFSSVFGDILFDNCSFLRFTPVLQEPSYNAYTGYNIIILNCHWELDASHNCIVQTGRLDKRVNSRPELAEKCWPNIDIDGLTIQTNNLQTCYIYKTDGENRYPYKIGFMSSVKFYNVKLSTDSETLRVIESNVKFQTTKRLKRKQKVNATISYQQNL